MAARDIRSVELLGKYGASRVVFKTVRAMKARKAQAATQEPLAVKVSAPVRGWVRVWMGACVGM
jgi:hypothetical protein